MKKTICVLSAVLLSISLASCSAGTKEQPSSAGQTDVITEEKSAMTETFTGTVVDGDGKSNILVASKEAGLLSLDISSSTITVNNQKSTPDALKNGMMIEFEGGEVRESYPGQMNPTRISVSAANENRNDICGLYAKIVKKLWETDDSLNDGWENLYIDLTNAQGLDDTLKAAVVYLTQNITGRTVTESTFDELREKGIFDKEEMYIKNGCLIKIDTEIKSDTKMNISAQKYVGGLGAIFFNDATAKQSKDGTWTFTPGDFAIA